MCAIAGMIGLSNDGATRQKMLKSMFRRGPDGSGIHTSQDCTLLHTRLAIIDPEGGGQPMSLLWNGEEYTITYNGELYNTSELRSSLVSLGHTFQGHSDTEIVLHAFAEWGTECLDRFNGIYAFAIWQKCSRQLFLARDRMGVKPLFYKEHNGGLIFASEIKTILAYSGIKAELDAEGAAQILLLGPGRTPGSGVIRGICELKPGHCAFYAQGKLHVKQYWKLLDREHAHSFSETCEQVRDLVRDAITRQMISDFPIGTFLSGGLDSSLISAVCAEEMKQAGSRLDTFSVDYVDHDKYFRPNKFQPNSDGSFIRLMQERIKSNHHWTVLSPEELVDSLQDATRARDLPGMADVDFSLFAFCKEIRTHVKVALSGECADEIFGGYPWYRDPEVRAAEGFPWAQNTKQRASYLHPQLLDAINPEEFVMERYWQTIRESDILPGTDPLERRMKEMVNLNQHWFMQTLLDRKDRMSMYHGLEVRVPFCDHRIAEYLYGVPWQFKDYGGKEKGLLRMAMADVLPDEVLWRKKSPYPKTYDPKYLQIVSGLLRNVINCPDSPILQMVDKKALESLLIAEYAWPWYGQLMKVPQTIAYMLQINFWLEEYQVRII